MHRKSVFRPLRQRVLESRRSSVGRLRGSSGLRRRRCGSAFLGGGVKHRTLDIGVSFRFHFFFATLSQPAPPSHPPRGGLLQDFSLIPPRAHGGASSGKNEEERARRSLLPPPRRREHRSVRRGMHEFRPLRQRVLESRRSSVERQQESSGQRRRRYGSAFLDAGVRAAQISASPRASARSPGASPVLGRVASHCRPSVPA